MARRRGNRRNYKFQSERRQQAAINRRQKKLEALRRLNAAIIRRQQLSEQYREQDEKRSRIKSIKPSKKMDRRGTSDDGFKGSRYYYENDKNAARSARRNSAQTKKPWEQPTSSWKTRAQLAALNNRRKKTRNSWSKDPCVEKPDSVKAAKARHSGSGGGYQPRRWC